MLLQLGKELRTQGKRLVLAREIGQVRDAIDHTGSESTPSELENSATVWAAVAAVREDGSSVCRHHRFVGGVAVGGDGFLPMPVEIESRCS